MDGGLVAKQPHGTIDVSRPVEDVCHPTQDPLIQEAIARGVNASRVGSMITLTWAATGRIVRDKEESRPDGQSGVTMASSPQSRSFRLGGVLLNIDRRAALRVEA